MFLIDLSRVRPPRSTCCVVFPHRFPHRPGRVTACLPACLCVPLRRELAVAKGALQFASKASLRDANALLEAYKVTGQAKLQSSPCRDGSWINTLEKPSGVVPTRKPPSTHRRRRGWTGKSRPWIDPFGYTSPLSLPARTIIHLNPLLFRAPLLSVCVLCVAASLFAWRRTRQGGRRQPKGFWGSVRCCSRLVSTTRRRCSRNFWTVTGPISPWTRACSG